MQHDFILLDRSGSMGNRWVEAINSVNNYVHELAKLGTPTGVTLVAFDEGPNGKIDFLTLRDRIVPSTWADVKGEEAPPRGMTPLNDAVGRIVDLAESGNYDKVAITIITDGAENASKEITHAMAKGRLDRCRARNWQVVFLGADFDNVQQAASYGANPGATVTMGTGNYGASTSHLAMARSAYSTTGAEMQFDVHVKAELAKKKPQVSAK